eukprot:TRINITY_DN8800_c0_g1_i1.p1 TRINITY_DN8800_c0_g1~~TRINITY_DN8800_c0_g1_i1.p1  ORF type:complete len:652 (+),score=72.48 TRINITY_DN8800_c0_g1_i1:62-2017(+)
MIGEASADVCQAQNDAKLTAKTSRFSQVCAELHSRRQSRVSSRDSITLDFLRQTQFGKTFSLSSQSSRSSAEQSIFNKAAKSTAFNVTAAVVIIANTILVGIEQSYDLQESVPQVMLAVESVFLVFYIMELVTRILAFGLTTCVHDGWIRFDAFLLVSGITFTWVLSNAIVADLPSWLTNLGLLRTARMFRLARMARLIPRLQPLWLLCQGALNSADTLGSVMIVLAGIVYMFGCIGFDLIGKHELLADPDTDAVFRQTVEEHFSSLPSSMLTVLSFLVFDSVRQIYWPLVSQDPTLILYFLAVFLLLGVVLGNMITAVIVNSALEQANADRESRAVVEKKSRQKLLNHFMELFRTLDEDGSGVITRDEVDCMREREAAQLASLTQIRDPAELFDVLDWDDSGEVGMDEFLKVVEHLAAHPGQQLQFSAMKRIHHAFSKANQGLLEAVNALADKFDHFSQGPLASTGSHGFLNGEFIKHTPQATMSSDPPEKALWPASFQGGQRHLPDSAPLWASKAHETLLKELESSTAQILSALRGESKKIMDANDARSNFTADDRFIAMQADPGEVRIALYERAAVKLGGVEEARLHDDGEEVDGCKMMPADTSQDELPQLPTIAQRPRRMPLLAASQQNCCILSERDLHEVVSRGAA